MPPVELVGVAGAQPHWRPGPFSRYQLRIIGASFQAPEQEDNSFPGSHLHGRASGASAGLRHGPCSALLSFESCQGAAARHSWALASTLHPRLMERGQDGS